jgi:diguanylate cyclase (GGDEF)-like protein
MSLFEIATTAHLAGSVVLALFFVLLERHDPRPYVRDWMAAWIAQVAALGALLASSREGWRPAFAAYLFLQALQAGFICVAARRYVGRGVAWLAPWLVLPLLAAAAIAPFLAPPDPLHAALQVFLALAHLAATALMWPLREPTGMGLRLTTNVLGLLALLFFVLAADYAGLGHALLGPVAAVDLAPFAILLLQMMLALGMVLTVMEAGQWVLTATNAQLREAEHRLKVLAETDPLTGCFNRRVFRDLVDDLRAHSEAPRGVVLMLDMDGLKAINDRHGHAAGDSAIRDVAAAIRTRTRTTDLVVRWGGDEFVVVIPGAEASEGGLRLRQLLEATQDAGYAVSGGGAAYGDGLDIMAAVDAADREMYASKSQRKASPAAAR